MLRYIQNGTRNPVTAGASGAILQAYTSDSAEFAPLRQTPLSLSRTGRQQDTAALACPVFGLHQTFTGALVLAGPAMRFEDDDLPPLKQALVEGAMQITRSIGGGTAPLQQLVPDFPHVAV